MSEDAHPDTLNTTPASRAEGPGPLLPDTLAQLMAEAARRADRLPKLDLRDYELVERVGAGGMGEVYRAADPALGRELAVKVIRAGYSGQDEAEQRFFREARVTGALQHPGIVPIHNLGRLADGRLHYTMRLVSGRTFAEVLRADRGKPECLPGLLVIFEKICQAVAYAHSKGVIHRDLKPANVMVGAFGEVQVMDWGLAKVLPEGRAEGQVAPAGPAAPGDTAFGLGPEDTPLDLSRVGAGMGTPAYMPPEQARGEWAAVDERADVFALGAVLCEVLTGQPPYAGANADEVYRRAQGGDLTEALSRLAECGADPALVGLCRECLAPARDDRPRDAGAVAERLAAYQAEVRERLRRAELERARAEERARQERKRRVLGAGLALAALLLLAGAAAVLWQWQRQRAEADNATAAALGEARLLREQAWTGPLTPAAYEKAVAAARKAAEVARTSGASPGLRAQADEGLAAAEAEAAAAEKDRRLLARLLEVRGPEAFRATMREGSGPTPGALRPLALARGPDDVPPDRPPDPGLTADRQFALAFRDWGLDVEAVPVAEAVARLKARPPAVVAEVAAALDEWAAEAQQGQPSLGCRRAAELAAALDEGPGPRRQELRAILARGRLPQESALAQLAAALRPAPVPAVVPLGPDSRRLSQLAAETATATEPLLRLVTLTRALQRAGQAAVAERLLRAALRARPREVVLYHTLGDLLAAWAPARLPEVIECYAAARALRPDLGVSLAVARVAGGQHREGLLLLDQMVQEKPDDLSLHFMQAYVFLTVPQVRDSDRAVASCRRALALAPESPTAYAVLASALDAQNDLAGAVAACRRAIALTPRSAGPYNTLGVVHRKQGDLDGATAAYRKAIELGPDDATAHYNLGNALRQKGDWGGAAGSYRRAVELRPRWANAWSNLAHAFYNLDRLDDAVTCWRRGLQLDPNDGLSHGMLGTALYRQGKVDDAIACYRRAIVLNPEYVVHHRLLGFVLHDKGNVDGAIACYRRAIALSATDANTFNMLGLALQTKKDQGDALECFQKAITINPKHAGAHLNLGMALQRGGDTAGALVHLRQAAKLDPAEARAHFYLGALLHGKGDVDGAVACFRRVIALTPKDGRAHGLLGELFLAQGRYAEARDSLRRGLRLLPAADGTRPVVAEKEQQCERYLALEGKLAEALRGGEAPADAAEALTMAQMCQEHRKHYVAAARLYAAAFAAAPGLADLPSHPRYDAACAATLAAAGKGRDAALLPDKVVTMLRARALHWLRGELTDCARLANQGGAAAKQEVRRLLEHWRGDPDLAAVRDPQAVARLPEVDRSAWAALWRDVGSLLKRLPPGRR